MSPREVSDRAQQSAADASEQLVTQHPLPPMLPMAATMPHYKHTQRER